MSGEINTRSIIDWRFDEMSDEVLATLFRRNKVRDALDELTGRYWSIIDEFTNILCGGNPIPHECTIKWMAHKVATKLFKEPTDEIKQSKQVSLEYLRGKAKQGLLVGRDKEDVRHEVWLKFRHAVQKYRWWTGRFENYLVGKIGKGKHSGGVLKIAVCDLIYAPQYRAPESLKAQVSPEFRIDQEWEEGWIREPKGGEYSNWFRTLTPRDRLIAYHVDVRGTDATELKHTYGLTRKDVMDYKKRARQALVDNLDRFKYLDHEILTELGIILPHQ